MATPNKLNLNYLLNEENDESKRNYDENHPHHPQHQVENGHKRPRKQDTSVGSASMPSISLGGFNGNQMRNQNHSNQERSLHLNQNSNHFTVSANIVRGCIEKGKPQPASPSDTAPGRKGPNRNFKCDICGRSFFERGTLIQLSIRTPPSSRMTFFTAHLFLTDMFFCTKGNLNKHVSSVHLKEKPKVCPEPGCGKSFSFRDGLMRHISHVHKNQRLHVCHLCQRSFKQASHLGKHMRTIHRSG